MNQNPTIPTVLEKACAVLTKIAFNPKNRVIAGAAGAVQVHVSASPYPTIKKASLALLYTLTPLPLLLYPSLYGTLPPYALWYYTPLPTVLHSFLPTGLHPHGTPPHLTLTLSSRSLSMVLNPYLTNPKP